jgi:O-succinylbenzoic acid--CoA ligase
MRALVALVMPAGPAFVTELRRAWDDGDAVLPVDVRLPGAERDRLIEVIGPSVVVDERGARTTRAGARPVEPGDALVVATSGTTGTPKGVVLTHDAVRASAVATTARLGIDPHRHRWLCCLPVAHVGGLSVITRALLTQTPLEVHAGFDAAAVTDAARAGATHTSLVTAALARIDASRFERILLGGAAAPAHVPPNCTLTYGMTETGSGIWYDDRALDGVEIDIRHGEIHVRAPMLLRAYRTAAADTDPKSADGWFATGDAGERTPDGGLVVHGRGSQVIVTGGEKVWPERVERVLAAHPAVADVLVTRRDDPAWGHVVVARVVLAADADALDLDELRDFARDVLAPYELPRTIEIVPSLERTALGKLRRV